MTVNDFLSLSDLDNINFFSLLRFCSKSQIARKLCGFVEKINNESTKVSLVHISVYIAYLRMSNA